MAISRAASCPVCRSRMIARGMTMAAQEPTPCRKRKAIRVSTLGAKAAADAAQDEKPQAEIERRLAAESIRERPVDDLADGHRQEEAHQAHLHGAHIDLNSRAMAGKAGRYMSMANGPTAESMPRTSALRRKADFIGNGFRSPGREAGIEKNGLNAGADQVRALSTEEISGALGSPALRRVRAVCMPSGPEVKTGLPSRPD